MKILGSFAIILALIWTASASAGNRRQVKHHQKKQAARIHQGVVSGELTPEEAAKLKQEQLNIQQQKRESIQDDGKLSEEERKKLHEMQKKASENIYEEKHDHQQQPQ